MVKLAEKIADAKKELAEDIAELEKITARGPAPARTDDARKAAAVSWAADVANWANWVEKDARALAELMREDARARVGASLIPGGDA